MKSVCMNLLVAFILACASLLVFAEPASAQSSNPYIFGGSCASNGYWTNTVLQQAQAIEKTIEDLASDPNCKVMHDSLMKHLSGIESQFSTQNAADSGAVGSLSSTNAQLTQMSSSLLSGGSFINKILANTILQKQVDKTSLMKTALNIMSDGSFDVAQRTSKSVAVGLSLFDSMADAMGNSPRCLSRRGQEGSQILASSIYMLAAFAEGGQSLSGARLAESISRLSRLVQDRKFATALSRIDNTFLQNSMTCLMEVTAESYCSMRDNIELLHLGMQTLGTHPILSDPLTSQAIAPDSAKNTLGTAPLVRTIVQNPYAGINILSRHLPNVTTYLQKVILGNDPNNEYEAQQKNDVMGDVNTFNTTSNNIKGVFYRIAQTVRTQESLSGQQQTVVLLLDQIMNLIKEANFQKINFFTTAHPAMEWPFILMGMPRETWPVEVISGKNGLQPVLWVTWVRGQISVNNLPIFQNPKDLLTVIERNLLHLLEESNDVATKYNRDWFLADKSQLIDEMFTDPQVPVVDSLQAIDTYLAQMQQRVVTLHGRAEILNSLSDTRLRIRNVLQAVKNYGETKSSGDPNDLKTAAGETLSTIYKSFNVLLSRTSFLSSRVTTYVKYDYKLMVDSGLDMSDYQRSLVTALGQGVLIDMQTLFNKGPEQSIVDLQQATSYVQTSLGTLEQVFIDEFIRQTAMVRLASEDRLQNQYEVFRDSNGRLALDSTPQSLQVQPTDSAQVRASKEALLRLDMALDPVTNVRTLWNMMAHGVRYPSLVRFWNSVNRAQAPDTEYGASKKVLQKMCIQSLQFNNWRNLSSICSGVTLGSVFEWTGGLTTAEKNFVTTSYDQVGNQYLKSSYRNEDERRKAIGLNYSNRVCALRNHFRNNYIYAVAVGRQK